MLSENIKITFLVAALIYSLSLIGVSNKEMPQTPEKPQDFSHEHFGIDSEIPQNQNFEPLDTCLCDHGLLATSDDDRQGTTCKCKNSKDSKCTCSVCTCNHCNK